MEIPIKIIAVCGWAIPPTWFENLVMSYFPKAEVQAVYPSRPADSQEAQRLLKNQAHLYIGYSLGTLWLLYHQRYLPQIAQKALLAPILSFVKEDKMGGKIPERQLKYFLKKFSGATNHRTLFYDFYSHSGLFLGEEFFPGIPARSVLINGLEFLYKVRVGGETTKNFSAFLGNNDLLLDSKDLKHHIPQLQIIQDTGHAPQKLLKSLANHMVFE